jgi:hypothetical protein
MPKLARLVLNVLVAMTLICVGCGRYRKWESKSPDGHGVLRIREAVGLWSRANIELYEDGRLRYMDSPPGEGLFYLVEVAWMPDRRVVGLLTCGEPHLGLAINRATGEPQPFSVAWPTIRDRLVRRYQIPPDSPEAKAWQSCAPRSFELQNPGALEDVPHFLEDR